MKQFLSIAVSIIALLLASGARAEQTPAGYVIAVALAGKDAAAKTAVVRDGKELPPKLMMPVFSGDVIFLRDPSSHIDLELGGGATVAIGGSLTRFDVKGEIPTGDDAWSIFAAIGSVLSGGEEEIPENMTAKGDDSLVAPLAVHGPNFIVKGERKLWLAWQGGTAPYVVTVSAGDKVATSPDVAVREIELPMAANTADRIAVKISDTNQQTLTLRFRLRDEAPALPTSLTTASPGKSTTAVLAAAWLAEQEQGAWAIEAAQLLHSRPREDQAAAALLTRMVKGWKPQ